MMKSDAKLVTIGVPIYRRLEYLPHVLQIVASQDYPNIELLVSDNGPNGSKVSDIVQSQYPRPFRLRSNPASVDITSHFNQIIAAAAGDFFIMLNDDDEITPNYVSALVAQMERHPQASFAIARQEIIDKDGVLLRQSKSNFPDKLSGPDCIRAIWQTYDFGFECVESVLARTHFLKSCGGYPNFTKGNAIDNALLIKLCLLGDVTFSPDCAFRWRVHDGGFGWSVTAAELADASLQFMRWLDTDSTVREFAATNSQQWEPLKEALVRNEWITYHWRWRDIYRHRMSTVGWVQAAFAMPFIRPYYRRVFSVFLRAAKARARNIIYRKRDAVTRVNSFKGS
jgi:glycosyltransferase involved in cell wall biosynthesis